LFDAVRGGDGQIRDFRFRYVNAKAEELVKKSRPDLLGQLLCDLLPVPKDGNFFQGCCRAVETGHPMDQEFVLSDETARLFEASWLRSRVVRLGDGVAVTTIDLSQMKEIEQRYEGIASFSD